MRGRCGKSLRAQWRAGIKGYLVGAPLYLGFILLNSRFIWGTFIFNWDGASWYFSGCYLLFPWVRILWTDLARWQSPDYRPPRRHSRDYSQLRRPLHADPADYAGVQLAVAGVKFVFAPLILVVLLSFRRYHERRYR